MSEGRGTRGAIILTWQQSPQQNQEQIAVLDRSVQYFDDLQDEKIVTQWRVYQDLNGGRNTAVLEGQIDDLIDMVKRVEHRDFLVACQLSLPGFTATTNIGGTNGDAEEVVRVVAQVREQVDQMVQDQQYQQGQQIRRQQANQGRSQFFNRQGQRRQQDQQDQQSDRELASSSSNRSS